MGETLQVYFGPCVYIYDLPNYPHNSFFFWVGWGGKSGGGGVPEINYAKSVLIYDLHEMRTCEMYAEIWHLLMIH